ncbi:MAG TPA: hypothetical protein VF438_00900, partial [Candidatus Paceibacterota bacterium]
SLFKKIGIGLAGIIATVSVAPAATHAQASSLAAGAASCAVGSFISSQITGAVTGLFGSAVNSTVSGSVPTYDSQAVQKLAKQEAKSFTLDRLASCAAKQLLHQMTADTVSWINSGFRGGPAFLQNPRGFLLDTADQLTGAFISDSGLLQDLCSPWNIDVRLTLALETTSGSFSNQRYACTLSTIIGQAKNASLDGFLNGDFRQGGWKAFIEMTAGSQNPAAQYLLAKSGLQSAINKKTDEINKDLQQGMGFLSSEKCTRVTYDEVGNVGAGEIFEAVDIIPYPDGTYEQCVKTTPGSFVAHALNVHTDSGIIESELANDINAVTSALFTQLTNQLLQKGLSSLSGSGSGSNVRISGRTTINSFVNQLQAAAYAPQTVTSGGSTYTVQNGTVTQTGQTPVNPVMDTYTNALTALNSTRAKYVAARDCLALISANDPGASEANLYRTTIDETLRNQVDPVIASTTAAQMSAASLTSYGAADTSKADSALATAQAKISFWDSDANGFAIACQNMNNTNQP